MKKVNTNLLFNVIRRKIIFTDDEIFFKAKPKLFFYCAFVNWSFKHNNIENFDVMLDLKSKLIWAIDNNENENNRNI